MKLNEKKYIVTSHHSTALLTNRSASSFWERVGYEENKVKNELTNVFTNPHISFFSYPVIQNENVHLFGFPYNHGSNKGYSKVQDFPLSLRMASLRLPIYLEENENSTSGIYDYLRKKYMMQNCMLVDHGDLCLENKNLEHINETILNILDYINSRKSKFCVVGGDHSITYILVKNLLKIVQKKIVLFQFDAHHDCGSDILKLDYEITHSNFVRFLLQEEMVAGVVQIGVRGLRSLGQTYEHSKLYQVQGYEMEELQAVMADIYQNNQEKLCGYVSFDVDVLDPRDFPLVDFPKIEGPKFQDVLDMIKRVFEVSPPIVGVDIVEGQSDGELDQYDPIIHIISTLLEELTNKKELKKNDHRLTQLYE